MVGRRVDHDDVVLGQHRPALDRVDREQRVVGDDDVGLPRLVPGQLGEAVLRHRAARGAEALAGGDADLAPGAVGNPGDELVAVAGRGLLGPLVQPRDLAAERGDLEGVEELVVARVLGLRAGLDLVAAQVVAAALEDREARGAAEGLRQRLGETREVAVDQLGLQRDGGGGDDDRLVGLQCVPDRGHEVGERLPGAGPGLDGEVLPGAQRPLDGRGHVLLALALSAPEGLDGGGEEVGHRGRLAHRRISRLGHRRPPPSPGIRVRRRRRGSG